MNSANHDSDQQKKEFFRSNYCFGVLG